MLAPAFLKRPKKPFFCSFGSKPLSSTTRELRVSPTEPRSFVLTFSSAMSENCVIFACASAPYCRIWFALLISIFPAKSSTAFFSASVSWILSSILTSLTVSGCADASTIIWSSCVSSSPGRIKTGISASFVSTVAAAAASIVFISSDIFITSVCFF